MQKRWKWWVSLLLSLTLLLAGCGAAKTADNTAASASSSAQGSAKAAVQTSVPQGTISIKMLDVGQGDAILIQTQEQTVLIDTSDVDERDKLRAQLAKAGVKKIDKVILTHPHADHIGGMEVLLDGSYEIGSIYDNGMPSTSKLYLSYMKKAKARGIPHHALKAGDVLDFGGGAQFKVLSPEESLVQKGQQKGYKHDPNNESVVGRLTFGQFAMLFTGDAEKEAEASIAARYGSELKSQVLKAPHHGSKTSSSAAYLRLVQPETCVISCGAGNDYGHPHKETLKKYAAIHAKTYETDKNGTITITSDGKSYEVKEEKS
ncbi:ComEC/Rec2 family competence protein [uncultured Mitsuokella sp.]|uniref:ComEC/Rec2 family competence protein n=1 Tax=uncultured Mitsuokella sp. TaxID=453120 RepID=UPI0013D99B41|nr:ComEC/Rec2 family competence protein [uncultured Mitsuokella sp.]